MDLLTLEGLLWAYSVSMLIIGQYLIYGFRCGVFAATATPHTGICPNGFRHRKGSCSCYKLFTSPQKSFNGAKIACNVAGAAGDYDHLVTLSDPAELWWLQEFIRGQTSSHAHIWVDYRRNESGSFSEPSTPDFGGAERDREGILTPGSWTPSSEYHQANIHEAEWEPYHPHGDSDYDCAAIHWDAHEHDHGHMAALLSEDCGSSEPYICEVEPSPAGECTPAPAVALTVPNVNDFASTGSFSITVKFSVPVDQGTFRPERLVVLGTTSADVSVADWPESDMTATVTIDPTPAKGLFTLMALEGLADGQSDGQGSLPSMPLVIHRGCRIDRQEWSTATQLDHYPKVLKPFDCALKCHHKSGCTHYTVKSDSVGSSSNGCYLHSGAISKEGHSDAAVSELLSCGPVHDVNEPHAWIAQNATSFNTTSFSVDIIFDELVRRSVSDLRRLVNMTAANSTAFDYSVTDVSSPRALVALKALRVDVNVTEAALKNGSMFLFQFNKSHAIVDFADNQLAAENRSAVIALHYAGPSLPLSVSTTPEPVTTVIPSTTPSPATTTSTTSTSTTTKSSTTSTSTTTTTSDPSTTAQVTTTPLPSTSTSTSAQPTTTEAPSTTTSPPVLDFDIIADDVDRLTDVSRLEKAEIQRAEDLIFSPDEDPPTTPGNDSDEAFVEYQNKLLATITVATSAAEDPSLLQREEKQVIKTVLASLNRTLAGRRRGLTSRPTTAGEVLLAATSLNVTIGSVRQSNNRGQLRYDATMARQSASILDSVVETSASLPALQTQQQQRQTLSEWQAPSSLTARDKTRVRESAEALLSSAAAIPQELHNAMLMHDGSSAYEIAERVGESTGRLGDVLLSALGGGPSQQLEVAGESCNMSLAFLDPQNGLSLSSSDNANLGVVLPSLNDTSRLSVRRLQVGGTVDPCAVISGGLPVPTAQLVFWEQGLFQTNDTNTTNWSARGGSSTVAVRRCNQEVKLDGSALSAPAVLTLPRPANVAARVVNLTANGSLVQRDEVGCGFWSTSDKAWSAEGCVVDTNASTADAVVCQCHHLSEFSVLFRTVIEDSSVTSVAEGSEGSVKRLGDAAAWNKNAAAQFVAVAGGVLVICLLLAFWSDMRHKVSDSDLVDLHLSDRLLEARYRQDMYLRQQREECFGRCYDCCCNSYPCQALQLTFNRITGRQATLHLKELQTIRLMRQYITVSLEQGIDLRLVAVQFSQARQEMEATINPAVAMQTPKRSRRFGSIAAQFANTPRRGPHMPKSRRSIIAGVKSSVPSLQEMVFQAFHEHLEKTRGLPSHFTNVMSKEKTEADQTEPVESLSVRVTEPRRRLRGSHDDVDASSEEERTGGMQMSTAVRPEMESNRQRDQRGVDQHAHGQAHRPKQHQPHHAEEEYDFVEGCCNREEVDLLRSGVLRDALRARLLLEVQRQQAACLLIQRWWRGKVSFLSVKIGAVRQPEDEPSEVMSSSRSAADPAQPTSYGLARDDRHLNDAIKGYVSRQRASQSGESGKGRLSVAVFDEDDRQKKGEGKPKKVLEMLSSLSLSSPVKRTEKEPLSPKNHDNAQEDHHTQRSLPDPEQEPPPPTKPPTKPTAQRGGRRDTISAPIRMTAKEAWEEVNREVDAITARTLRRIEYIEWPKARLFSEVCRRDHPLLQLFIIHPSLTAVQRTLVFGSVVLGLLLVAAFFYQYGERDLTRDGHLADFKLAEGFEVTFTIRQFAILIWAVILAKVTVTV
ncbi:unnamed protein product [Vitrella brassicaformis CCMP3155]|uniref:C-type lectin domain-containing protein n=2 Tax=Vitrella brassicaformis TaxID=1169539 RepID=A0A0G4FHM0_VITBC|nr:unnamed protein product [Vitrella brassicaformis CCMP3155]|eukprot:CEM12935.1 unnamed protein product [Vitrella brassicaformis CCMP3155]